MSDKRLNLDAALSVNLPFSDAEKAAGLDREEAWPRVEMERRRQYRATGRVYEGPFLVGDEVPDAERMIYVPLSVVRDLLG